MKNLIVPKKYDKKKLNSFLLDSFDGLSLNTIFKFLRKKDIIVNGKRINNNIILKENDEVIIYIPDNLLYKKIDYQIIYEDENILIVNKPTDIEIVGEYSLTSILKQNLHLDFIEPCHRLDRNTIGLVIFAKNIESRDILLNKFKSHEISKFYKCVVVGIPKPSTAELEAYLFKDAKKSEVYISDTFNKGYLKIITCYKTLKTNNSKNISLLEIELKTGRTHQIRAHLAHIGHPILGDGKYGINNINKQFGLKNQALCAYKIVFNFKTDSSILNYLNNKDFCINNFQFEYLL